MSTESPGTTFLTPSPPYRNDPHLNNQTKSLIPTYVHVSPDRLNYRPSDPNLGTPIIRSVPMVHTNEWTGPLYRRSLPGVPTKSPGLVPVYRRTTGSLYRWLPPGVPLKRPDPVPVYGKTVRTYTQTTPTGSPDKESRPYLLGYEFFLTLPN